MAFKIVTETLSSSSVNTATMAMASGHSLLKRELNDWLLGGGTSKFFYYNRQGSRDWMRVLVNSALSPVTATLKQQAIDGAKKLAKNIALTKKQKEKQALIEKQRQEKEKKNKEHWDKVNKCYETEKNKYGIIKLTDLNGQEQSVVCTDMYGYECNDGLMTKISTQQEITYNRTANNSVGNSENTFTSHDLVWMDPTAIISINSSKNLILTKVAGRDYTRKELVSNGDINFSVSGHIMSDMPDIYPAEKVKSFIQTMQYKGVIEVNNIILDQFGIKKIVIKDFSMPTSTGNKAHLQYSFNAVGIQPERETEAMTDTLVSRVEEAEPTQEKAQSKWKKFLKQMADGAVYQVEDLADTAGSIGYNNLINGIK